jgi:hypothetical protein
MLPIARTDVLHRVQADEFVAAAGFIGGRCAGHYYVDAVTGGQPAAATGLMKIENARCLPITVESIMSLNRHGIVGVDRFVTKSCWPLTMRPASFTDYQRRVRGAAGEDQSAGTSFTVTNLGEVVCDGISRWRRPRHCRSADAAGAVVAAQTAQVNATNGADQRTTGQHCMSVRSANREVLISLSVGAELSSFFGFKHDAVAEHRYSIYVVGPIVERCCRPRLTG